METKLNIFTILLFLSLILSVSSIRITCYFSFFNLDIVGNSYTCSVTSINSSDNSSYVTSYTGAHVAGYLSANVTFLYFHAHYCPSLNLTFIPRGFLDFFPNIKSIQLNGCGITTLNVNELDYNNNMVRFLFLNSTLQRVHGQFSITMPNVERIDFNDNQLQNVGSGLLDDLNSLSRVYFTNNHCINVFAPNQSFVPALIEALRIQCPDIDDTTTTDSSTTSSTTLSSTEPQKCEIGKIEDAVCELEDEITYLKDTIKYLEEKLDKHSSKLEELESLIFDLITRP